MGRALCICVHGFMGSKFQLSPMASRLARQGFDVLNFSYPSRRGTMEQHGASLADVVRFRVEEYAKLEQSSISLNAVHFVAHSFGGLVVSVDASSWWHLLFMDRKSDVSSERYLVQCEMWYELWLGRIPERSSYMNQRKILRGRLSFRALLKFLLSSVKLNLTHFWTSLTTASWHARSPVCDNRTGFSACVHPTTSCYIIGG